MKSLLIPLESVGSHTEFPFVLLFTTVYYFVILYINECYCILGNIQILRNHILAPPDPPPPPCNHLDVNQILRNHLVTPPE